MVSSSTPRSEDLPFVGLLANRSPACQLRFSAAHDHMVD